ncbi:TnsD family transposase [Clostridium sp. SHJSY1]|uniref:TnsD family Tn7-like transposition protein n=1 Tax=Clostridium sp. SHJSY1 TaxID=2942483 RepID=UPI00287637B5|nr:TnsD family Tn7-like transposition protein [Clostridium sp. SHJSY1]MDS0527610.1 TnsD family transposase [Clostridium sp. SHJSY1]
MDRNRLTFFPTPYPSELFYGVISRYKVWSGIIDNKTVLKELYNTTNIIAGRLLPANFRLLYKNIPERYVIKAEELIKSNTAYNFYTTFSTTEIKDNVYENMLSSNGSRIYNVLGLCNNRIKSNTNLRYCKMCIEEDRKRYGEAYWHLEHQLDGVLICRKHKTMLKTFSKDKGRINRQEWFNLEVEHNLQEDNDIHKLDNRELELQLIYCNNVHKILSSNYKRLEMNDAREVYVQQLINKKIASNKMNLNQEALLKSFVGLYGEEYLRKVGAEVNINNKSNWVTHIVRKHRTMYHPLQHLLMIQFLGLDIDEMFANREVKKQKVYKEKSNEETQKYRTKWSNLLNEYPSYNTTKIRKIDISTYTWLYKYDNEWLKQNSPRRNRKGNNSKIDWDKRDLELLEQVKKAVEDILESEGKPERVSVGAIGRKIGNRYLLGRNLYRLKETKEYLDENIESIEEFQKRRYRWVEEKFPELRQWERMRLVGIK